MLLQIDVEYACFGIWVEIKPDTLVRNGVCTEAAPIARWMIGKQLWSIVDWVNSKKGKIQFIDKEGDVWSLSLT